MAKFHINGSGNAGICRAQSGGCPFGGEEKHFDSMEEARTAYETTMASEAAPESSKPVDKKTQRLLAKAEIPSEQSFGKMIPFSSSEAIEAGGKVLIPEDEDAAVAEGWRDSDGFVGDRWKSFADSAFRAKRIQAEHNVARYEAALRFSEYDSRSLKEIVESGAIDEDSPRTRLSDAEINAIKDLGELPVATQELVQNQPPGFVRVLADTPSGNANVRALAQLSDELRRMDPSYAPRAGDAPPSRLNGYIDRRAGNGTPQMQKVGAYGYGLLQDYARARFGDRAREFWLTVKSDSVNYPKISDYMRALKSFE